MILYKKLTKYTEMIIPIGMSGEYYINCCLYLDYYFLGVKITSRKINTTLSMFSDIKKWHDHWDNLIKNNVKLSIWKL